jgi:allophanate hydrolase
MPPADDITSLDIARLLPRLRSGALTPSGVIEAVLKRIEHAGQNNVWIYRIPAAELRARAADLDRAGPDRKPLYGIPCAIKDNIDFAGYPTTAGCPAYAYTPDASATVVRRLEAAGAIIVGKTNLDQFATGLVGVRTPYGVARNPFEARYIPGGSSSGSAVAVASGLVSFALGTDTAGSGRVPAAFNNIVGLKPTRGLVSTRGIVPARRSLDCVSIFALTAEDAGLVLKAIRGYDPGDPFSRVDDGPCARATPAEPSRLRFGVPLPDQLEFFGDREYAALFAEAVARLESLGAKRREIDLSPFLEAAALLYDAPGVAERYLVVRELLECDPEALHPVTRTVIADGGAATAADAFAARYRLEECRSRAEYAWGSVDVLLLPTAPTIYTIAEVDADPIRLNSNLGRYTNFMNLLDLAGIAVPAGFRRDGLPFGVTLVGPAFADAALVRLGAALHHAAGLNLGAMGVAPPPPPAEEPREPGWVQIAVCGAHMAGLPLNHEITRRGGRFVRTCRTAPIYRLFALDGTDPPRPGMLRSEPGRAIEVEVWTLPTAHFGGFVASVPAPLAIGTVALEDGSSVHGFLCEAHATREALDITGHGGWRAFLATPRPAAG